MVNCVVLYVDFEWEVLKMVCIVLIKLFMVICMFKFVFNVVDDGFVG